ncbi:MAG: stage II sporulation protein M [Myxococcaceae bacterium]|nr:stage II sporulation protein M [Myxococcaceae bacterium]
MSESIAQFVMRRRPDWDALAELLDRQRAGTLVLADLERLDRLYRSAAADLAHAQAHFAQSDAHRFLNQLCTRAYGAIYQPPKDRLGAIRRFYRREFPQVFRAQLRYVGASAFLFGLGLLIGALVVLLDPNGAELLVPDHLREYIAQKKMWTDDIFQVTPGELASSQIATNNLTVTIAAFALGLTWGAGTVFVMLNNGVHIGSVAALCIREGMGGALGEWISAHGFVELSIIVIAGGAGLMLAHALVDPGELPRGQALRRKGTDAVKLVVGCAPFLFGTGFVEGFVSPNFPAVVKVVLGLSLGIAFWSYLLFTGRSPSPAPALRARGARVARP